MRLHPVMITTSLVRLSVLATLLAALTASVHSTAAGLHNDHARRMTNAERFARGLPPNPPTRRRPGNHGS